MNLRRTRQSSPGQGVVLARVTRPDQLWRLVELPMPSRGRETTAHVLLDCCTREMIWWWSSRGDSDQHTLICLESAVVERGVPAGRLTLDLPAGLRRHATCSPVAGTSTLPENSRDPRIDGLAHRIVTDLCELKPAEHDYDVGRALRAYAAAYNTCAQPELGGFSPTDVAAAWLRR